MLIEQLPGTSSGCREVTHQPIRGMRDSIERMLRVLRWVGCVLILGPFWMVQNGIVSEANAQHAADPSSADEPKALEVRWESDAGIETIQARIVVEAQDGGLLLAKPNGSLVVIQPDQIRDRKLLAEVPEPLTFDEMEAELLAEMPEGFKCRRTDHFLICYNTSDAYAQWNGSMYERLFRGFNNYWKTRRVELDQPIYPMVAIVFDTRENYLAYARKEVGDAAEGMSGYYAILNNRVVTFDLTGMEGIRSNAMRLNTGQVINQILSLPQAERTVATIIHEAVHQISYNSNLQKRLVDNPLWVSEGMATYFEAPDLTSSSGWGGIGKVNQFSNNNFRLSLQSWTPDTLKTLISSDAAFQNPRTVAFAYGQSWALTHFLLRTKRKEYCDYLEHLRQKQPLGEEDAATRMAEFKTFFGDDLEKFEIIFLRYMRRIR